MQFTDEHLLLKIEYVKPYYTFFLSSRTYYLFYILIMATKPIYIFSNLVMYVYIATDRSLLFWTIIITILLSVIYIKTVTIELRRVNQQWQKIWGQI